MSLHNDVHIKPVDTKSPIQVRGLKAHGTSPAKTIKVNLLFGSEH